MGTILRHIQDPKDIRMVHSGLQILKDRLLEGSSSSLRSRSAFNRKSVGRASGPTIVVQAMDRRTRNTEINTLGCWVLGHLAEDHKVGTSVVTNGGIDAIVRAMIVFPENTLLQHYGCFALRTILEHSSKSAKAVIGKGGVDVILMAQQNHPQNKGIVVHSSRALNTAATHKKGAQEIIKYGGSSELRSSCHSSIRTDQSSLFSSPSSVYTSYREYHESDAVLDQLADRLFDTLDGFGECRACES